jgi:hypothetical protein
LSTASVRVDPPPQAWAKLARLIASDQFQTDFIVAHPVRLSHDILPGPMSISTILLAGVLVMQSLSGTATFGNTQPEWVGHPVIPQDRFPPEIYANSGVWVASQAELPIVSIQHSPPFRYMIRYIDGSMSGSGRRPFRCCSW